MKVADKDIPAEAQAEAQAEVRTGHGNKPESRRIPRGRKPPAKFRGDDFCQELYSWDPPGDNEVVTSQNYFFRRMGNPYLHLPEKKREFLIFLDLCLPVYYNETNPLRIIRITLRTSPIKIERGLNSA